MTVISELNNSLQAMGLEQHVFAFVFVMSYMLAVGQWFHSRGRLRAGFVAFVAAIGFCTLTTPWVHGAMLLVLAVAGLGVFIGAAWTLSRLLALNGSDEVPAIDQAVAQPVPMAVRGRASKLPQQPTTQSA